ncbi:MAG: hypothetical protein AMJ53_11950 [Gammaproteobacteria bacterium SG8_11]|nr:MAG: hypothetical protein AMJ53_11950 [Gammaproteobacteria bacterium SG8_11]
MRAAIFIIGSLAIVTTTLWAQPVYKSVDQDGNVTYSSTPPEDAKHVEDTGIVSSPTAGAVDDVEKIKQAADELERDRKARESERANQKAAAEAQEKSRAPVEKPVIQRHRPIIQQPIPPASGKPSQPPATTLPVVPVPPSPPPPVAVPLGGGGGN